MNEENGYHKNVKPASSRIVPRKPCANPIAETASFVGAAVLLVCNAGVELEGGGAWVLEAAGWPAVLVLPVLPLAVVLVVIVVSVVMLVATPAMALLADERWAASADDADASDAEAAEFRAVALLDAAELMALAPVDAAEAALDAEATALDADAPAFEACDAAAEEADFKAEMGTGTFGAGTTLGVAIADPTAEAVEEILAPAWDAEA